MRLGHLGVAGGFALLGTTMLANTSSMRAVAHIEFGPALFPTIVGWLMIGFAVIAGLDALRMPARAGVEAADDSKPASRPNIPLFVGFIAAPIFFMVAAPVLGFLLTMPLIIGGLAWLASGRIVVSGMLAIGLTLALHLLFYQALRVTLPWGLLTPFAGVLTWS
jgi:putative tricarboxylic transport membrane protein